MKHSTADAGELPAAIADHPDGCACARCQSLEVCPICSRRKLDMDWCFSCRRLVYLRPSCRRTGRLSALQHRLDAAQTHLVAEDGVGVAAVGQHGDQAERGELLLHFHRDHIAARRSPASPWDVLLNAPPMRLTKLDLLRAILRDHSSLTTLSLSVQADLTSRQVWGLLKAPRATGEVVFKNGRWALVPDFPGRDVKRAAELLRAHGWFVEPPEAIRC